ncbi:MAG: hypothetical protein L3J01_05345, partial [Thiomicrorhabdus sp.]|nr:hypothetical protein [Thiomicrorhabdus sp.]
MKIEERNLNAKYFVNAKLGRASELNEEEFPEFVSGTEINKLLTDLIEVHAKGFRGVVLTAIVGMKFNSEYDPLNDFYGCNPRAIFEEGIWYALTENSIPCGKSDPLNVAKNISQLDESWAKGRRPQKSAIAAVKFLRKLVKSKGVKREKLIDYFFFRLFKYAQTLSNYEIVPAESKGISNRQVAKKLNQFMLAFPESGNIPQVLIANLIAMLFTSSEIEVKGGGESVFGTNTTSKKPADIWLEMAGQPLNLYEITVKKVNYKRLDDCISALRDLDCLTKPVTFICRMPEDVNEINVEDGFLNYKGKRFDFVDIQYFIISVACLLRPEQLGVVVSELEKFVSDVNISFKTKEGWNSIFTSDS